MRKIILALFCFFCLANLNAQVTFNPGFRGGVNFNHFSKGDQAYYNDGYTSDRNFETKTDFYLGFYGALKLSKFYTLQPEINYSRQGSVYKYYDEDLMIDRERKLEISYLSIGIANKFTFKNFNVHLGPTMDFVVDKNFNPDAEVDLAFFLGAGYSFNNNFGIEARIKKGIIPVLDYSDGNHTNVVISLGAVYSFDVN